jgi:hypothetical protein
MFERREEAGRIRGDVSMQRRRGKDMRVVSKKN